MKEIIRLAIFEVLRWMRIGLMLYRFEKNIQPKGGEGKATNCPTHNDLGFFCHISGLLSNVA